MTHAVLIYPHQLFLEHPALQCDALIVLIEDPLFFTQYRFHKQKLMLHRASMKHYDAHLRAQGYEVLYVESAQIVHSGDIVSVLQSRGITTVGWCNPVDDWLERRVSEALASAQMTLETHDSPLFLLSDAQAREYVAAHGTKQLRMQHFYQWQRLRMGILLDTKKHPIGGQWSFDTDNRKKLPKTHPIPADPPPLSSPEIEEARVYVQTHFADHYGTTELFGYPVTHAQASEWLDDFLIQKLASFGPFEDAMTTRGSVLYHSLLSPLINIGLLTPAQVVAAVESCMARTPEYHLPSVEGFIRQVIGWREYMRLVYITHGRTIRTSNHFNATRSLPASFWNATTGLAPVDHVIQTTLSRAYSHHITRLMVMGNIMALTGVKPDDAYRWFMEMYIDAYDWVMVPNVYSMALFADGGIITTKPYVSSSRYILSMSDYPKGPWCEIWDGLFWTFVGSQLTTIESQRRLGMMAVQYNKMSKEKREAHEAHAQQYIKKTFNR